MKFSLTQHQSYFRKAERHFALPENKNDLFQKELKNHKIQNIASISKSFKVISDPVLNKQCYFLSRTTTLEQMTL